MLDKKSYRRDAEDAEKKAGRLLGIFPILEIISVYGLTDRNNWDDSAFRKAFVCHAERGWGLPPLIFC
jgi:hypothetical protein